MSRQVAVAGALSQEFVLARTARSRNSLGVSVEELLGLKPVADKPAPRNTRLRLKLREIEKLPASDRRAVIELVDGLLARQKLDSRGTRQ